MKGACPTHRSSFTLVELLVAIGIIAVLMAILLSVLQKARRKAVILTAPIAFIGEDYAVYVTVANGGACVQVSPRGVSAYPPSSMANGVHWSPSGTRLAFYGSGGTHVIEPMTGSVWKFHYGAFRAWLDQDTFLAATPGQQSEYMYVKVGVEGIPDKFKPPAGVTIAAISSTPPGARAPFVAWVQGPEKGFGAIRWLRKDLSPGGIIYIEPNASAAQGSHDAPFVDAHGERVAWGDWLDLCIRNVKDSPGGPRHSISTKVPPFEKDANVCGWLEDGRLLLNCSENRGDKIRGQLAYFGKDGKFLRFIETEVRPIAGPVASFRRFGHQ